MKKYHTGTVKKTVTIKASKQKVWKKISNIVGLDWLEGQKRTTYLSKKKRDVGSIRKIFFDNGDIVEEHIVGWKNNEYFSYIAVSGLPLRAYHATISMESGKNSQKITWQSYFNSEKMTRKEFSDFVKFLSCFYQNSLKNLKISLE
ncbi:MAG: SRPBCC family protein [Crenarchaeota archaeon]|nr:MAG: SRPBCC family protein [Thermoproteota archaeon]RDJ34010.1 MAG: SRPBCC family protein [Thermoproteota archaeon]RDJ36875.1 MAG: SRPBCC family protein [Thermoproteota archaeon]RDJ37590.1 MAG: SRPBCC family protein [Thermoproteota archaeon]